MVQLEKGESNLGNPEFTIDLKALETIDKIGHLKNAKLLVHAAESAYAKGDKIIVKHILKIFAVSDIEWDANDNQQRLFVIFRYCS